MIKAANITKINKNYPKIINLIPADNWYNMYINNCGDSFYSKVSAIALVEYDDGTQLIKHIDADDWGDFDLELSNHNSNFVKPVYSMYNLCEENHDQRY